MNKPPNTTTKLFAGEIKQRNDKRVIIWNSPDFVRFQIEKFTVGTKITAYITSKKPARSLLQNNYYWMYLKLIEDDTGNNSNDLHNYFKGKYLSNGITEVFGSKVRKLKSTTALNKSEFTEYLLSIEEESGIMLPDTSEFNPQHY